MASTIRLAFLAVSLRAAVRVHADQEVFLFLEDIQFLHNKPPYRRVSHRPQKTFSSAVPLNSLLPVSFSMAARMWSRLGA